MPTRPLPIGVSQDQRNPLRPLPVGVFRDQRNPLRPLPVTSSFVTEEEIDSKTIRLPQAFPQYSKEGVERPYLNSIEEIDRAFGEGRIKGKEYTIRDPKLQEYFKENYSNATIISSPTPKTTVDKYEPEYDTLERAGFNMDEEITEDMVRGNKVWIDSAKTIYKDEEDEEFKGTDDEASAWLLDRHAKYSWDLTNLGSTAVSSKDWDQDTKQAWLDSMNIYDEMSSNAKTWGRSIYHLVTDPTFLPSFILGLGWGAVAKTLGGKAAALAARSSFKAMLKEGLIKEGLKQGLSKKAAVAVAEKASQGSANAAIKTLGKKPVLAARKKAARKLAKRQGAIGASIAAGESALDDVFRQDVEREIGLQTHYDPVRTLMSGGIGAVAGGVFGAGGAKLGTNLSKAGKVTQKTDDDLTNEYGTQTNVRESLEDVELEPEEMLGIIDEARDNLTQDGTAIFDVGKIWDIVSPRYKKKLKDTGKKNKADHIESHLRLKFKDVKKVTRDGKVSFEVSGKALPNSTDVSRITKETMGVPPRTFKQRFDDIKARANLYLSTTAGLTEELGEASVQRQSNLRQAENSINRSMKILHRTLRKDFGIGRFGSLNKIQKTAAENPDAVSLETVTEAFKGNKEAINKLEDNGFTDTLNKIRDFRRNVNAHQEMMVEIGLVPSKMKKINNDLELEQFKEITGNDKLKIGDEVETNRLAFQIDRTKGTDADPLGRMAEDVDLWLTRSYEIHNNPEWSRFINETEQGQKIRQTAYEAIVDRLKKSDKNNTLGREEREKLANEFIDNLLSKGEEGEITADFLSSTWTNTKNNKSLSIFKGRKLDDEAEIRALMGEKTDPFSVVAETLWKMNQAIETFKYQKAIRDVAERGTVEGLTLGRREGLVSLGDVVGKSVSRKSARLAEQESPMIGGVSKPLENVFASPIIKNALEMGNEIAPMQNSLLKKYVFLQGLTRSAKTVYSESAWARNFITAGLMAFGNGHVNPVGIAQFRHVLRGLVDSTNEELGAQIDKMIALDLHQSGLDIGALRAVLDETGSGSFFMQGNKNFMKGKPTQKIKNAAVKFQTTAANIYQAADDMWKWYAFAGERANYGKVLRAKGLNPDEVVRTIRKGDGTEVEITRLDEYAAKAVRETMQNYGQVPRAVKFIRRLPFADFIAYKTELFRTSKNTLKRSFTDIKEGMEDIKRTNGKVGYSQLFVGAKRLTSFTTAMASVPALSYTSAEVTGLNEYVELPNGELSEFTKEEGIRKVTDREWDRGADWLWLGDIDKNGKGKRINLSWLNPWQPLQGPLKAAYREIYEGRYPEPDSVEAANQLFVRPLFETFGTSMLIEGVAGVLFNVDRYGKPMTDMDDPVSNKALSGVKRMWEAFEPGLVRDAKKVIESYNLRGKSPIEGVGGITKSGRELIPEDQWIAMAGIKPETYDVPRSIGYKFNRLKARFNNATKDLKNMFKDYRPTNPQDYIDMYRNQLDTQYKIMGEARELYQSGLSTGLSQSQIIKGITGDGLFASKLTPNLVASMGNFFYSKPPTPEFAVKMSILIKRQTGIQVPVEEIYDGIYKVHSEYIGKQFR